GAAKSRLRRVGPDRDAEARERGLGDGHDGLDGIPAEPSEQDLLDAPPRAPAVLIARQVDEAGVEAAEGIAPAEQPDAPPLLQRENAVADAREVLQRGLEQVVARERVDDVLQHLGAMAARLDVAEADQTLGLETQQGNIARQL